MGNAHIKPHPRQRNKKQVHWKAAARPYAPGKPFLVTESESTPDLVTIRWIKPISDGGSPITGYLVEHRRAGSPHWVRATPLLVKLTELTISGLEPGWRYQFRIRAENGVGLSDASELSEPITVTLHRSAVTAPRITQELQDTVGLENEKAEFVVHFLGQPAPKVCWYKDAFEIFSSRRIRILTEPDRSVLTIHQCSLSDEGEIKCTATNRAGHVSSKAKLTVNAPPSIRLPRQYADGLLFEIGELIRLKVSLAGRPTPLVFWTHNGESINSDDRYEIESVDNSSVLKINDARREDRGEYIIRAVNKLGEDVQSFLVTITDKPSPPGNARVVMALGRSVTLSWGTPRDDGGCKIGNYIVEYYRLGWDVWLKAATSRQLSTILGDLIEGSEYKFRVKAESPYGISEPSAETEVVFIPDAKRGILQPPLRSKSHPRDIVEKVVTPIARRKNKERSLSSPRVEDEQQIPTTVPQEVNNLSPPQRPVRTKIKSPSKTPEASPLPPRKKLESPVNKRELETKLNKEIFERSDRSSMARDLAYGSPDIKVKRELQPMSSMSSAGSSPDKSRTPSPNLAQKVEDHKSFTVKIQPPQENTASKKTPPASPELRKMRLSRENSENLTGSSEFMLVLYPDEDQRGQSDFDFGDDSIPPPMSLSAPELGVGAPIFNMLKTSASSTELLHERAMNRLYEAAKAEEKELERRRKSIGFSSEIPKIQINSKDQQEKLDLERLHSVKRRLSGGTTQTLRIRRHSYKGPDDIKEEEFNALLQRSNLSQSEKKELMMNWQRSESEEREEKIFEDIRHRTASNKATALEKRKINIVDVEKWADDYVSSTEESSFEDDEEERRERSNIKYSFFNSEDEEQTYHPRGLKILVQDSKEPFEILTKRKDPPSPDFIPKPILKKTDHEEAQPHTLSPPTSPKMKRSLSPIPPLFKKDISLAEASLNLPLLQRTIPEGEEVFSYSRPRSASLTYEEDMFPKNNADEKPVKQRKRAFSLLPQAELFQKSLVEDKPITTRQRSFSLIPPSDETKSKITPESIYNSEPPKTSFLMQTISAAATITGITAASIVIPDRLMEKQKDAEESKVVVDHYGDIVKNYGSRNRNPHVHQSRESLQRQSRESLLPRVDESKEELSLDNHLANSKISFKNDNITSSNYRDPYSQHTPTRANKTDSLRNYHDPYTSYRAYEENNNRNYNNDVNTNTNENKSKESLNFPAEHIQPPSRRSLSPSSEERQQKASPSSSKEYISTSPTINRSRNVSESSDTSKNRTRAFSPPPDNEPRAFSPSTDRNNRNRAFSPATDRHNRSRTASESSDKAKSRTRAFSPPSDEGHSTGSFSPSSDRKTRNRAFSPPSNRDNRQRRERTFSPPSDSEWKARTPAGRKISSSPMRKTEKRKTASPYPTTRTSSNSSMEERYSNRIPSKRKTSPSPMRTKRTEPSPMRIRPPMLKEIMTQTSEGLGSFEGDYPGSSLRSLKHEELIAKAEVKVHRFVDYLTDLVMIMVACWLYLFKNELFAIPVLLVLVYRQLQAEISKRNRQLQAEVSRRIPNWLVRLVRRLRRKQENKS